MSETVLRTEDLTVVYHVPGGVIRAVDGVSLELAAGETLAVVGESGCGKTTLAKAILGLERAAGGKIVVQGKDVTGDLRGLAKRVGIVWQDPYASLDSRWTIGDSISEPLVIHKHPNPRERAVEVMKETGLDPGLMDRYPHQLSGGQRQRVAIARALALNPPLVLCDEPTAALDLSIRAQILNLLKDLQASRSCAYLYISHDLMTVRYIADRVAVMYLGRIVEIGPTGDVFGAPRHPYTQALMASAPTLELVGRLPAVLAGEIPDPRVRVPGCRFSSRCPRRQDRCVEAEPELTIEGDRGYRCYFPVSALTESNAV